MRMRFSITFVTALVFSHVTAATGFVGEETDALPSPEDIDTQMRANPFPYGFPFPRPKPRPRKTLTATTSAGPQPTSSSGFINWRTFKANGVNLGSWLEKEKTHDPIWWASFGGAAAEANDEWTFCKALGRRCGPALEARYASFLNTSTIDKLASVGVNTLRIPTTYAAWVRVPGSAFHTGNQIGFLRRITEYAIDRYNMHVIIGLHSLPGGVNSLDIGEAFGHNAWFFNSTNLRYSYQAIDRILDFIKTSDRIASFTIAPINEASDNLASFGSSDGLSAKAGAYVNAYVNGCLQKISQVNKRIPLMLQDNFKGATYWSTFYNASTNLVIDSHVYYFAAAGTYSQYIAGAVCGQGQYLAQEKKFPVFIGEWSLQTVYNNTRAGRQAVFNVQRYAWQKYVAGSAFWTAVSYSTTKVDGEGTQRDYWSYVDLINSGVAKLPTSQSYC